MSKRIRIARRLSEGALCLLLLLALPRAAAAEPVQTVVNNGDPANRIDIAILGDGYTPGELSKYASDVQGVVQSLFQQEPFREYQRFFNVHRIDVPSAESGADHPERSTFRSTAFDAAYNCSGIQRLICANLGKVMNAASNSLGPAQHDLIILIVNDPEYGGSGGAVSIASTDPRVVELILHESGHTFGLLADEYTESPPACFDAVEPPEVNATLATARASTKWNAWIEPSTPIPTASTTPALPGLYLGAKYCPSSLFRPTFDSKMRTLGRPFEQVNSEQLIRRIYNRVSPIDSATPAATTVSLTPAQSQTFTVNTPSPLTHELTVSWFIDGQPTGGSPSLTVAPGTLSAGTHTVEAVVRDPTMMVRSDPEQLLTESVRWSVTVRSANQIDGTPFFVSQHYIDFFSREADAPGLAHWTNVIDSCGQDAQCREVTSINVSGAFFLSIEFQQTGYLIERIYKSAYGDATATSTLNGTHQLQVPVVRLEEFLPDTQRVGRDVVVNQGDWQGQLEANKVAFTREFVQRARFTADFPPAMLGHEFVDRLVQRSGAVLTANERQLLISEYASAQGSTAARASVLRQVAEHRSVEEAEKNRAFVLMQYFGYLRRDPNEGPDTDYTGYDFWLGNLNKFNGNFVQAELVKAFITSAEYRQRFNH